MRRIRDILSFKAIHEVAAPQSSAEPTTREAATVNVSAVETSLSYWSRYHVSAPGSGFASITESLDHLDWRNRQYPGYIELMPVDCADGLVLVDYGCGPGNDVIGFGHYSRPKRIHAVDVSPMSLALARKRAELHGITAEFHQTDETSCRIPLEDASCDFVHCSGVLHHTPDPLAILREFRRIMKPEARGQIMVYHYDSIWMHLYVAYEKMIGDDNFAGLSKKQAFTRSTDGPDCPISVSYKPTEFIALAETAGLRCEFAGSSISAHELKLLPRRFEALQDRRLDAESRKFLYELTFDERGWPRHDGVVAGINSCFRFSRR